MPQIWDPSNEKLHKAFEKFLKFRGISSADKDFWLQLQRLFDMWRKNNVLLMPSHVIAMSNALIEVSQKAIRASAETATSTAFRITVQMISDMDVEVVRRRLWDDILVPKLQAFLLMEGKKGTETNMGAALGEALYLIK